MVKKGLYKRREAPKMPLYMLHADTAERHEGMGQRLHAAPEIGREVAAAKTGEPHVGASDLRSAEDGRRRAPDGRPFGERGGPDG